MTRLRQDQIRTKVQTYFKAQLDQYLDWLDRRGLSKNALADAHEEMLDHDCMVELEGLNPQYLPIARFKRKMGISDEDWQDSLPRIAIELRKGRRDMLRDVLDAAESLENYSFRDTPSARYTNHYMRGSFKDKMRDAEVGLEVHNAILGHDQHTVSASYGRGPSLAAMKTAVDKAQHPYLGWIAQGTACREG